MNKILLFTLFAVTITACGTSTSSKKSVESSRLQQPIAETTPVSRIVTEVTPSSIPTLKAVPEVDSTIEAVTESTKPLATATNPIAKTSDTATNLTQETKQSAKTAGKLINPTQVLEQSAKSVEKPANSTQKIEKSAKANNNPQKPVSVDKLVANISSKIGCGKVDQKYKIRVATIAIANYNPKILEGLSRKQIRQAVKKSIADYPERAEGLVEEYRSQFCQVAQNPTAIDNQQRVTSTAKVIPPSKLNSCKKLRARGIKDIDVAVNPWARKFDRDDDGIACESK
ncbi:hypothetical protein NIES267_62800 [Calothrix parasitica NIES-267]|uniref:Excalibur calcium-binding domain-containing protein n=1 Tax=Calothrix parasitica NIES-267 TaxID=1973488 RepID=A0A1Z4LZU5_9CYAN|nr:hypothetical protein NIES267_62800 [Calothrix parasitica NIES-267]